MRDAFRAIRDHPNWQVPGSDLRYRQIAGAQLEIGDIPGATDSINAVKHAPADELARLGLAEALAGRQANARATVARALASASVARPPLPNPNPAAKKVSPAKPNALGLLGAKAAEAQAVAGNVPDALQTARMIDDPWYQLDALERVIQARAMVGDIAGALRLGLNESKTPDERRVALAGVGVGVETRVSLDARLTPGR